MKAQLKDKSLITGIQGQVEKGSDTYYRVRNNKQQIVRKSKNPYQPTPARLLCQQIMAEASRRAKEIMENPELRRQYEILFNNYNPHKPGNKEFENLRGFIKHCLYAEIKAAKQI